jgi:multiple sugar transport system ATP-binding protein
MRSELKAVLAQSGTTTIYVTHDQTEAMGLADRIALMHRGVIEQIAAPQVIYERPATKFVGGFVGSPPMNFITMPINGGHASLGAFRAPSPAKGGDVVCGIRAEDMTIVADGQGLPFEVAVREPLGAQLLLTGKVSGQLVRVSARPDAKIKAGDRIGLSPNLNRIVWLDPASGNAIAA